MNRPLRKTFIDSKNLQYTDLPTITLITGEEWRPSEKEFLQWCSSYPDADLAGELCRIEEWFQKHPDRRKTERGMHTFVKTWLNREMHGATLNQHSTKRGRYQNAFNDFDLRHEYDYEELEADLLNISGGPNIN